MPYLRYALWYACGWIIAVVIPAIVIPLLKTHARPGGWQAGEDVLVLICTVVSFGVATLVYKVRPSARRAFVAIVFGMMASLVPAAFFFIISR